PAMRPSKRSPTSSRTASGETPAAPWPPVNPEEGSPPRDPSPRRSVAAGAWAASTAARWPCVFDVRPLHKDSDNAARNEPCRPLRTPDAQPAPSRTISTPPSVGYRRAVGRDAHGTRTAFGAAGPPLRQGRPRPETLL